MAIYLVDPFFFHALVVRKKSLMWNYECSAGEEMALVEHMKGMAAREGSKRELKLLLLALVMLGEAETARKLQRAAESSQLAQMAAVKLAEDTVSNNIMDDQTHSLEYYMQNMRGQVQDSEAFLWRCKVFPPPTQV